MARYGGEEFALMLPNTDIDAALMIADRLRTAIGNPETEEAVVDTCRRRTVSVGVAGARSSISLSELMSQADAALYRAKQCGRTGNCGLRSRCHELLTNLSHQDAS